MDGVGGDTVGTAPGLPLDLKEVVVEERIDGSDAGSDNGGVDEEGTVPSLSASLPSSPAPMAAVAVVASESASLLSKSSFPDMVIDGGAADGVEKQSVSLTIPVEVDAKDAGPLADEWLLEDEIKEEDDIKSGKSVDISLEDSYDDDDDDFEADKDDSAEMDDDYDDDFEADKNEEETPPPAPLAKRVHFAPEVSVHTRPFTEPCDVASLFYSSEELDSFHNEYEAEFEAGVESDEGQWLSVVK
jgi:hypothetical protein